MTGAKSPRNEGAKPFSWWQEALWEESRENIPKSSHFLAFEEALAAEHPCWGRESQTVRGCCSRRVHTPRQRLPAYLPSQILKKGFLPSMR